MVIAHDSPAKGRFLALYRRDDRLAAAVGLNRNRRLTQYRSMPAAGTPWAEAVDASRAA